MLLSHATPKQVTRITLRKPLRAKRCPDNTPQPQNEDAAQHSEVAALECDQHLHLLSHEMRLGHESYAVDR